MNENEVIRRLPELLKINDDKVYRGTLKYFKEDCPNYFWTCPASTSGKYHPEDETGKHGLWLHTKRVNSVYERLSDSLLEQQRMDDYIFDLGRAAVLIHDSYRLGYPEEENEDTVAEHGEIAANVVREETDLPKAVSNSVESHDGAWGKGTTPSTDLEDIVHYSDMIASERGFDIPVVNPHEILYDMDTVTVRDYVGVPRYESMADKVAEEDLVYAFGVTKTRYGWRVFLKSPYEAKDDIKELDNRWWNDDVRMWQIKPEEYNFVMNKMQEDGWETKADSRVEDFVSTFE